MKNILVIGGSYFLGRVFTETMVQESDCRIYVLNRGNRPLNMASVKEICCDRNDIQGLKSNIPKQSWHAVVDFCAYNPMDVMNLFSGLTRHTVRRYIMISSVSVYRPTKVLPIVESSPKLTRPQPELGPAADYGFLKCQAEQAAFQYCRKKDIPFTFLRPAIIYGKYNYAPRESYFFDLIRKGRPIILPEMDLPLFQFVSVWDVVRMIQLCIENQSTCDQTYNLAAEELVSYGRLNEVLKAVTDENFETLSMSIEEINRRRIPLPFPLDGHLIYAGTLIQKTLGCSYESLTSGMRKTYDWYRDNSNDADNQRRCNG